VSPQSANETQALRVRQPDFNFTNFGTLTGGGSRELLGSAKIDSLVYRAVSTGTTISLGPPGGYQNSSYHLDFDGPALKCAPANETYIDGLTYRYGNRADTMVFTSFLAWTRPGLPDTELISRELDISSDEISGLYVMTNKGFWNVSRTYNGTAGKGSYRQVNVTQCVLYNATYSVDYQFAYPEQSMKASISDWINPVDYPLYSSNPYAYEDNATANSILSYHIVMGAFTQMVSGKATTDKYRSQQITSTIWKLAHIDWGVGPAVADGLEGIFQNITLSLLSDDALM
jgi:hypothetical protein